MGAGVSFAELAAFMNERDDRAEAKDDRAEAKAEKARQEAKAEKAEMEAKLEQQRQETAQQMQEAKRQRQESDQEVDRLRDAAVEARVREAQTHEHQIVALQSRLETMHAAKLLNDEELDGIEDAIADS